MSEGLEELRALSDRASEGHWVVTQKRGRRDGYIRAGLRAQTVADLRYKNGEADAAFIVAAVNYVRELLREP